MREKKFVASEVQRSNSRAGRPADIVVTLISGVLVLEIAEGTASAEDSVAQSVRSCGIAFDTRASQ